MINYTNQKYTFFPKLYMTRWIENENWNDDNSNYSLCLQPSKCSRWKELYHETVYPEPLNQLWSGFGPAGTFLLDIPYLGSISSPSSELGEGTAAVENIFHDGGESSLFSLSNKWYPEIGTLRPETWPEKWPTTKMAKKKSTNGKGKLLLCLMIMGVKVEEIIDLVQRKDGRGVKVVMVNTL